jgi:hypothetical protein
MQSCSSPMEIHGRLKSHPVTGQPDKSEIRQRAKSVSVHDYCGTVPLDESKNSTGKLYAPHPHNMKLNSNTGVVY